ncbi:hypothetical protein V8G54_015456 [Vigna mungo]|uniref:Uncharacterized protein n=1 Tax=Vigna mungo TaxID=3915 RepID=A0AAQ3NL77_VIGMU
MRGCRIQWERSHGRRDGSRGQGCASFGGREGCRRRGWEGEERDLSAEAPARGRGMWIWFWRGKRAWRREGNACGRGSFATPSVEWTVRENDCFSDLGFSFRVLDLVDWKG